MKGWKSVKRTIVLAAAVMLSGAMTAGLKAQEAVTEQERKIWPDKTPVVYIGYSPDSGTDHAVRLVVGEMAAFLGEEISCQNMEGNNSADAAEYVLGIPHDGYSMMATGSGGCSSWGVQGYSESTWRDWLSFHAFSGPAVLFANRESNISTMDELLSFVSGGGSFGIGEYGNGPHTQFEAIRTAAGLEPPLYSSFGSCRNAAAACLAGDVSCGMGSLSAVLEYLGEDRLVPVAVTSEKAVTVTVPADQEREEETITIPSVTTLMDGVQDISKLNETWPIMIPRDTPQEIVEALTEAFLYAIGTDDVKEYAAASGCEIIGYTGEEADRFMSYLLSAYAWTIYRADQAVVSPEKLGIPSPEEYSWENVKQEP